MTESSGLDPDFVDEESRKNIEDYLCCVCQLIPNYYSALEEVNCGHLFCSSCLTQWMQKSKKCPFCKSNIITRKVEQENKIIFRYLINLKVKCPNDDCSWKGSWKELDIHNDKVHIKDNKNINENVIFHLGEVYKSKIHPDKLKFVGKTLDPWKCHCIINGNCISGNINEEQIPDINHFSCLKCDFNLCEKCMRYYYESNTNSNLIELSIENKKTEKSIYDLNQLYLSKVHKHLLKYLGVTDSEWFCDGRKLENKCYSGTTDIGQNQNIPRFRCEKCDFDLCLNCMNHYIIKGKKYILNNTYIISMHKHPVTYIGVTNDTWHCDGNGLIRNCISGISDYKEREIPRFRCEQCDFDICINCFDYYSNVEKSCKIF